MSPVFLHFRRHLPHQTPVLRDGHPPRQRPVRPGAGATAGAIRAVAPVVMVSMGELMGNLVGSSGEFQGRDLSFLHLTTKT